MGHVVIIIPIVFQMGTVPKNSLNHLVIKLTQMYGYPRYIRRDNGRHFIKEIIIVNQFNVKTKIELKGIFLFFFILTSIAVISFVQNNNNIINLFLFFFDG
jgi:hypothetical protein